MSGPAVKAIRFTLPLVFAFVVFFPVVAWALAECLKEGELFAWCPNWLWAFLVPLFLCMTWAEWRCFRILVVPYVQWLHPFKVLGVEVTLWKWFASTLVMSSTAKLDIATNGLFSAKMFATFACQDSLWSTAQAAWEETIRTSSMAHVPSVDQLVTHPCVVIFICVVCWIIIVVQLVLAFLMTHPWKGVGQTDCAWQSEAAGYSTIWTRLFNSTTKIWHADVVRILASATRNVTIMQQSCSWQMERVRQHLDMKKASGTDFSEQRRCFDMLRDSSLRMVMKLWMFTILEKSVFMETQTSMYALIRALNKNGDGEVNLVLLISFLCLAKAFCDTRSQISSLLGAHTAVMNQIKGLREKDLELDADVQQELEHDSDDVKAFEGPFEKLKTYLMRLPKPGDLPVQGGVLLEARRAKMIVLIGMRFGTVALFLILVHVFAKLVMAHVCDYGLWSVPHDKVSLRNWGCVDLSNVKMLMDARAQGAMPE